MKKKDLENAVEVEVEIVDDGNSETSGYANVDDKSNQDKSSTENAGIKPWIPLIIAIAYTVFPVDIIPDTIPALGYLDDALFMAVGALNGLEKSTFSSNAMLQKVLKYIKWGLLGAGLVAVIIIVLLVVVVVKTVGG